MDLFIRIALPSLAIAILTVKLIKPQIFSDDIVLKLILAIVAGLAIAESLSRFLTLDEIKRKVDGLHDYDIPNKKLLEIAHNSGIVALSPRFSEEWIFDITKEIKNSNTHLDICGVALPSIIKKKELKETILKHSEKNDIRILLLDPNCDEAKRRANIEKPLGTRTIEDIKGTIEWLKEQMADNKRIRVHKYILPPMLGLYITEHYLFVESYHFGRPEGIEGCLGGYVPLLKIKNSPEKTDQNTFLFYKDHFQYLWNETRGNRAELQFTTTELVEDSHITITNRNDFDIKMGGWNLAARDKQAYQFDNEFVWKKEEKIKIFFADVDSNSNRNTWNIDQLKKNSLLTMLNSSGTTVSQWAA